MEKLVKKAEELGAETAEVFFSEDSGFSFSTEKRRVSSKEFSSEEGFGVRVFKKHRLGFAHCQRKKDFERAVKLALSFSKFSPEIKEFSFAGKSGVGKAPSFDARVESLAAEDGVNMVKELLKGVLENAEPTECELSFARGRVRILNSNGVELEETRTEVSCYATAESGGTSAGYGAGDSMLEFDPFQVGLEAGELAKKSAGAKPFPSGETTVVFDARALNSFISELLLPSFDGENARRGISVLCGKKGEQIASEEFSLADEPLARGPNSSAFDDEGVASKKKELVGNGVFRHFLFDLKTAAMAPELEPEAGNCSRSSYDSSPSIGCSNLVIGRGSCRDVLGEIGSGLLVSSFFGGHTANKVTGDFSVSVDLGFEIKEGMPGKAVRGMVISGNAFTMLENIIAIEREQESFFDLRAPKIAFSKVSVSS